MWSVQRCQHQGCNQESYTGFWCQDCIEQEWPYAALDSQHWIVWKGVNRIRAKSFAGALGCPYQLGRVVIPGEGNGFHLRIMRSVMTAIGLSYLGYRSNWLLSPLGGIKERYGTHVLAAAVRVRYCWLRSDLVLDSLSAVLPLAAFPRAELPGVEHATDWLADVNTYLVNIETFEEAMRAQVQRQLGHITEHLGELLVDEQYERKVQAFSAEMLKPQEWALYQLSQQAIVVLALRRGLINGHPRTLRQVARTCHLSRKQVRQIEITALEKLKLPKRQEEMGRLRDLLLTENRTPRYIA